MTDFLSKISQRVRDNIKDWYEAAGTKTADQSDKDKAFLTLQQLASLLTEGVPAREVSAVLLVYADNPAVSIANLIGASRDKRNDPTIAPFLNLLKSTLLPPPARGVSGAVDKDGKVVNDAPKNAADEAVLLAKEKEQATNSAKLVYESTAIKSTLLQTFGKTAHPTDLEAAKERYERALGRKLNDEECFA